MVRVVLFLIFVGIVALGAGWIADRPGGVEIVWLGYHITTSVAVLAAVILLAVAALLFLWWALTSLVRSPARVSNYFRMRRIARGQHAITQGFIAIGAGDPRAAARHASEAKRLASEHPMTLLLTAQAAQLSGDRIAAERAYEQMAARPELKAIGLHGMFVEARNRNDALAARAFAEEAAKTAPSLGWAGQAVLEFRCAAGDWNGALEALDRNRINGLIDKARYRRERAVLLTAQAEQLADADRDRAKAMAVEAAKLAPDLVPAAVLAGRFHADAGDMRKASRVLETAWKANPHSDVAEMYIHLRPGDAARERLLRAQKLLKLQPGHVEGALALARAAIDAQAFTMAREALAPLLAAPTQRVALLMADLEEAEHNDVGRARAWTAWAVRAARDPAWTADGFVSDRWMPVSPATGRLDAFEWKVPVAQLPGAAIESENEIATTVPAEAELPPPAVEAAPEPTSAKAEATAAPAPPAVVTEAAVASAAPPKRPAPPAAEPVIPPVIPLVHAPDDPGTDPFDDTDPAAIPQAENGRKLRDLFK
jgi:HemY protein